MKPAKKDQPNVDFFDTLVAEEDSQADLLAGLLQEQKVVSPKWFYDMEGSELFEAITQLPEYYPTRTEIGILTDNKNSISERLGVDSVIIEPGSGSSEKIRLLLNAVRPAAYIPVDISADFLREAAIALGQEFPWLQIRAVCADFNTSWSFLNHLPSGKRIVFYPGSTLGNLEPEAAKRFLLRVKEIVGNRGGLLVGVDLHKETAVLHAAYNDSAGVTGRFNMNLLKRLNLELGAEFDLSRFRHHAFYNEEKQRIEMHLVSLETHTVRCRGANLTFEAGESIHTENSYKYTPARFESLAASAGLQIEQSWHDERSLFGVHYLSPCD
ncbi:MAG: L-histidine N(alpha)-methyltransferase [Pseudomonadota bacterium]